MFLKGSLSYHHYHCQDCQAIIDSCQFDECDLCTKDDAFFLDAVDFAGIYKPITEYGVKSEEEEIPKSDLALERIRKDFYTNQLGIIDPKGKWMVAAQAEDVERGA